MDTKASAVSVGLVYDWVVKRHILNITVFFLAFFTGLASLNVDWQFIFQDEETEFKCVN